MKHIMATCQSNDIGLKIQGSFARGTAGCFSDIDLTVFGNITKNAIRSILFDFEVPIMINTSEKPPGLLIVAYSQGLAMDLSINRVSINESDKSIVLVSPKTTKTDCNHPIEDYLTELENINRHSKVAKLAHKGLLKFLNGKQGEAREFILEIRECIKDYHYTTTDLIDEFQHIVNRLLDLNERARQDFMWLIQKAKDGDKRAKMGTLT